MSTVCLHWQLRVSVSFSLALLERPAAPATDMANGARSVGSLVLALGHHRSSIRSPKIHRARPTPFARQDDDRRRAFLQSPTETKTLPPT
jgi:hypothetical protein